MSGKEDELQTWQTKKWFSKIEEIYEKQRMLNEWELIVIEGSNKQLVLCGSASSNNQFILRDQWYTKKYSCRTVKKLQINSINC